MRARVVDVAPYQAGGFRMGLATVGSASGYWQSGVGSPWAKVGSLIDFAAGVELSPYKIKQVTTYSGGLYDLYFENGDRLRFTGTPFGLKGQFVGVTVVPDVLGQLGIIPIPHNPNPNAGGAFGLPAAHAPLRPAPAAVDADIDWQLDAFTR